VLLEVLKGYLLFDCEPLQVLLLSFPAVTTVTDTGDGTFTRKLVLRITRAYGMVSGWYRKRVLVKATGMQGL